MKNAIRIVSWVPYWAFRLAIAVAAFSVMIASMVLCRVADALLDALGLHRACEEVAYWISVWVDFLGRALDQWTCDVRPRP